MAGPGVRITQCKKKNNQIGSEPNRLRMHEQTPIAIYRAVKIKQ